MYVFLAWAPCKYLLIIVKNLCGQSAHQTSGVYRPLSATLDQQALMLSYCAVAQRLHILKY